MRGVLRAPGRPSAAPCPADLKRRWLDRPGHAGVREAVVGRQDDALGSVVRATVVPADPSCPPELDQLVSYCRARLAGYKVPVRIEVVAGLARSHAGKVERFCY